MSGPIGVRDCSTRVCRRSWSSGTGRKKPGPSRHYGLEREEFERAKASWLGREVIHLQGVRELAGVATVDELVGLGWDHYRKTPGLIEALTEETVRDVAQSYLRDETRIIVRLTT